MIKMRKIWSEKLALVALLNEKVANTQIVIVVSARMLVIIAKTLLKIYYFNIDELSRSRVPFKLSI